MDIARTVYIVHTGVHCTYRCTLYVKGYMYSKHNFLMPSSIIPQVAAVSGDARRALDIARRATEIAQLEKGAGLVGIPHIDKAVQEMFSSAKIQAVR